MAEWVQLWAAGVGILAVAVIAVCVISATSETDR